MERRVLVVTAKPEGNVSFYRAVHPLKKAGVKFDIMNPDFNTGSLKEYDCVLMTQAYGHMHVAIAEKCLELGVKLWLDYDDLLTDVTPWSPKSWLEFKQPWVKENMDKLMSMATWITYSTPYLNNHFNNNGHVIPNAFDHKFFSNPSDHGNQKEVMYRGGDSHNLDLWTYHRPILNALRHKDWVPHFVGFNPIYINMELNGIWTPQLEAMEYWKFLEERCNGGILMVPLKDSKFNRSKSNIAWVEGTYAGCAVLAPNWPEWQRPGIINYDNESDFERKLVAMMSGRINLKEKMLKSREWIMENLTLEKINELRIELLNRYL